MFQTEINIGLQALGSKALTWLMYHITTTGYYSFVIALVLVIMLGVNLRKGFLLLQIIAWTAIVSQIVKDLFGLPRPFFTDSRVTCLEPGWDAATPFRAQGAPSFFSLPSRTVVEAFRLRGLNCGFPSGHVTGSVALWGGLAVLFRKRWLLWLAPIVITLMAFSRLYLGVHFLADVLGAILLGVIMLSLAYLFIGSTEGQRRFFSAVKAKASSALPLILYIFILFILPILFAVFANIPAVFVGFYIGLNAAFTLILVKGLPEDGGSLLVRATRVVLCGLLYFLINWASSQALHLLHVPTDAAWIGFIVAGLGSFLTLWGSVKLFLKLGLYKESTSVLSREQ